MFDELLNDDRPKEECGVFAVVGHPEAALVTYYGLHALQHRGQESCGIVTTGEKQPYHQRGMGLVSEVFSAEGVSALRGNAALGHVRYTTSGESRIENAQPLTLRYRNGFLAIAHNGSLVNAAQVRHYLEKQGSIFQTTSDTEVIAHLIARSAYDDIALAAKEALSIVKGAYALVIMTEDRTIACVDPNGLRPLSLGKLTDSMVVASETCAFDLIHAEYVRDVQPGEMVTLTGQGIESEFFARNTQKALCSFEFIYFSRPDSDMDGINVHLGRKELGRRLASEHPVEADLVIGVPDSSLSAAIGFAEASGLPFEFGLIKNRYVGRTFIQPSQYLRDQGVRLKLSAVRRVVEGQRVVMVDDSIVRGTTSSRIVKMLREAGASEVHVRISSPPVRFPCYYGIDISSQEELIVTQKSIEELRVHINADSLGFISVDGLLAAVGSSEELPNKGRCMACFTGEYPTEIYPEAGGERQ